MAFTGTVTLTGEQFQALLSRIRENASVTLAAAPPAPPSPDQTLVDRMYSIDQPRPRPPFDARAVLADMASERQDDELRRVVAAQVEAQLAAVRTTGKRA